MRISFYPVTTSGSYCRNKDAVLFILLYTFRFAFALWFLRYVVAGSRVSYQYSEANSETP